MARPKQRRSYLVQFGRTVLRLTEAKEGGYIVTSPLDPGLVTQAESIEEAFANAAEAARSLLQARRKLLTRRPKSRAS